MTNVVVLHGPNLNLLGERPGDEPGLTLDKLNVLIRAKATSLELPLRIHQTNHEGGLIDHLHSERKWADAFLINPGALTHYSYALRDAIAAIGKPVIEVHLSDLNKREAFRKETVLGDVVLARVMGKGAQSYMEALERLAKEDAVPKVKETEPLVAHAKTVGRKQQAPAAPAKSSGKTIGKATAVAAVEKSSAGKSIGRAAANKISAARSNTLTRNVVREKIAERLSGKLTPSALSTWARSHWAEMQGGAATESGQREVIEDTLQMLMLSAQPAGKLSDDQLVDLMTQLE
ncbi:MAG: type II 3-dehydroquinate dehydratase [Myxococcaceae bacterium]